MSNHVSIHIKSFFIVHCRYFFLALHDRNCALRTKTHVWLSYYKILSHAFWVHSSRTNVWPLHVVKFLRHLKTTLQQVREDHQTLKKRKFQSLSYCSRIRSVLLQLSYYRQLKSVKHPTQENNEEQKQEVPHFFQWRKHTGKSKTVASIATAQPATQLNQGFEDMKYHNFIEDKKYVKFLESFAKDNKDRMNQKRRLCDHEVGVEITQIQESYRDLKSYLEDLIQYQILDIQISEYEIYEETCYSSKTNRQLQQKKKVLCTKLYETKSNERSNKIWKVRGDSRVTRERSYVGDFSSHHW